MSRQIVIKQPKPKKKAVSVIIGVIMTLIILFVLFVLIVSVWLNNTHFVIVVQGTSMYNTLENGDRLYASYDTNAKRGDIIIIDATHNSAFSSEDGTERLLIKRLIAIEGDSVKCEDGVVYLKEAGGEYRALEEPYLTQTTGDFNEVTVGRGQIFFLGDNRRDSKDARVSGCMNAADIVGIVPEWAVWNKGIITGWEGFRKSVLEFFTIETVHQTGG